MSSRWIRACVLACVLALAAVGAATALASPRQSAPPPGPKSLLLVPSDFSGSAKVVEQKHTATSSYRFYGPGLRLGATRFLVVYAAVELMDDAASARADLLSFKSELRRAAARERIIRMFGEQLTGPSVKIKRSYAGPFTFAGPDAAQFMGTSVTSLGQIRLGLGVLHVDRAVATVLVVGLLRGEVSRADLSRTIGLARERMRAAFTIAVSSPPVIAGTAAIGQVLTVDEGSWTGGPSSFTYEWSRCDATGVTCAAIPGATAQTYTVDAADVGSTLRVGVTGLNAVSSRSGPSAATAVVPAPLPPPPPPA